MIDSYNEDAPSSEGAISIFEYKDIINEIEEQPKWRAIADSEMDYADGNQLDGALLQKQIELGLPPAVENLIGPALRAIQGYEQAVRTDWRVTPNGEVGGQDVADAINYKLNQAERNSKADKACSDAFATQIGCGIGWVEVSREQNLFKFPYRCRAIHRNEIHWDMNAVEADLSDARWLRRAKWLRPERVALAFPQHAELIKRLGAHGASWYNSDVTDGGTNTGLSNAWGVGRQHSLQEQRWYNPTNKEICIFELWYRRWESVPAIKTPDGRVVEYDENNDNHVMAVAAGITKPVMTTVSRMRRSYWLGAHMLDDAPSPYEHDSFPYVPFWGFREDATGLPYGYVRDMKYPQDSLNSGISKLRWGMSVARVERTAGAVAMSDAAMRRQVARPDGDVLLDANHMAKNGARFEVKRDYELTNQHFQMLTENRNTIDNTSGINASFKGKDGSAQSGYQESIQIEQSNQSLADVMDNFREGRKQVGELMLSMIIEDLGQEEHTIVIEGDAVTQDRTVVINAPELDPETGLSYLSNDIQRTRLMVALEDVPSTNSYRAQQLSAFSEAVKSLPPEYQVAAMPYMISLMDIPHKDNFIEDVRAIQQQQSPEQIEQEKQAAIEEALMKAGNELKQRELEIKERKADSEIKNLDAKAVQIGVQAAFAAMQGGAQVAQMPQIAPIADEIMMGAGYQRPNPMGDDPNYPTPTEAAARNLRSPYIEGQGAQLGSEQLPEMQKLEQDGQANEMAPVEGVRQNTSPQFPPVPQDGASAMQGIETARVTDNLPVQ